MLEGKKILITGATGFIGASLVHKLVEMNCDVSIITRKESNKWRIETILNRVKNYNVDLREYGAVKKLISDVEPDIVYHLATYGAYPFQTDFKKIIETNVIGIVNLLNACANIDYECFINTGSSSEYGVKMHPMSEDDILEPVNDYGVSKAFAALYCQAQTRTHQFPIVTLRLFSAYGYYEEPTRLIPYVIKSCLLGKSPELASGSSVRDFIFIEDVIDAYLKAATLKNICGEILNVGTGKHHSVKEVVETIIELIGNKVKPQWDMVSRTFEEPSMWVSDNSKIMKSLDWKPKYSLRDGLSKTIDWLKNNLKYYLKENGTDT